MSTDVSPEAPVAPELRLEDKVIILTGASSGLGEQLAVALQRAGAVTVLAARRRERLVRMVRDAERTLVMGCDVSQAEDRERLVRETIDRFGRIDGLVNNAGVTNVVPAVKEDLDDFRRVLEVNLVAPFALARAVAPHFRASGGGSIVNIASINGIQAFAMVPEAAYSASKAALIGLTKELATQWARYGIRVNAVAPGSFVSEMTGDAFLEGPVADAIRRRVPLGRPGRAGELDAAVLLLLHPSSGYITGQTIVVDGGLTIC